MGFISLCVDGFVRMPRVWELPGIFGIGFFQNANTFPAEIVVEFLPLQKEEGAFVFSSECHLLFIGKDFDPQSLHCMWYQQMTPVYLWLIIISLGSFKSIWRDFVGLCHK